MKILDLISGIALAITNEEQEFIDKHPGNIKLSLLDDHNSWIVQNLVRKGVYSISKNNILVNNIDATKSSKSIS